MKNLNKINEWFGFLGKVIVRMRVVILTILAVLTIIGIYGLTLIELDNSIESWFLDNADIKLSKANFEEHFGNSEYVAFLIEADDIFSHQSLTQIRQLGKDLMQEIEFADNITSIADMEFSYADEDMIVIDDLVPDEIPTDHGELEAIKRQAFSKRHLKNVFFTEDGKQTWLLLELEPFPDEWKGVYEYEPINLVGRQVLDFLKKYEYPDLKLYATGMPVYAVEDLKYGEEEFGKLFLLSLVVSITILIIFLRSVKGVVIPLMSTIISIIIVFGFMGIFGIQLNAVMMTVPVFLGFGVSIGYSIHLFNHWKREFFHTGKRKEAVYFAVKETGWPLLFTALTTIGSLLSFLFINLVPLQWLGATTATVIAVVYIIIMLLTPALLSFGKDKEPAKIKGQAALVKSERFFDRIAHTVLKYARISVILFIVLSVIFIWGMTRTSININTADSYGTRVDYMNRLMYIAESPIGSFLAYDLTIRFENEEYIKKPAVLQSLDELIAGIKDFKYTKRANSINTIIKDLYQLLNEDNPDYYIIPDDTVMISQLLFLYELGGGKELAKWIGNESNALRVTVELSDMDTKEIIENLVSIETEAKQRFSQAEISITGSMPEFAALNQYVAAGQIKSYLIALFVIMLLMMIAFRSVKLGLIGMIPNIAPALVIGGGMGLLQLPIDLFTVTMIPMILGLAVDDTIHFISHCRLEYSRTNDYDTSIYETFKSVGKALFMTSVIIMAAFSVYVFSSAKMIITMGVFIVLGIGSALLADYFITPVLVKWFKPFDK